jgi:hypothetical protein
MNGDAVAQASAPEIRRLLHKRSGKVVPVQIVHRRMSMNHLVNEMESADDQQACQQ